MAIAGPTEYLQRARGASSRQQAEAKLSIYQIGNQ